jgi:lysozyme family protein
MAISLTAALRDEYQRLFDGCIIDPARARAVDALASRIAGASERYDAVGRPLGIPWQLIGIIHCMEASLDFRTHLHNGDPLTARTRQVPKGRPQEGSPPFAWEVSATDALRLANLDRWSDWSVPGILYRLEAYNGFGYRTRHPEVLSPYLWSWSNQYTSGKYVADGTWSPTAVSKQCGAAVLLRRQAEAGTLRVDATDVVVPEEDAPATEDLEPLIRYSVSKRSENAERLQRLLNTFPGIYVRVDGVPGTRTSEAFRKVSGHYLVGDPRAAGGSRAPRRTKRRR